MLQHSGKRISIIITCRTFDLEHDPEIKNWLSGAERDGFKKVEIKKLDENFLKQFIGPTASTLTGRELELLRNPQNLYMWLELKKTELPLIFATSTELIRKFWENRRQVLSEHAHLTPDMINSVLDPLVDYMEKNGKISAPERFLSNNPHVIKALISYGILQIDAKSISFCHQRYLDFFIADRLLQQITCGTGNIIEWLGVRSEQSLFRREQLRQILLLLSEESSFEFIKEVRNILCHEDIRFHLKHLVLEIIGSLHSVSRELFVLCLEFYDQPFWRRHVLETVFYNHQAYVGLLIEEGMVSEWVTSDTENSKSIFWLLRSVVEQIPDKVASVLEEISNDDPENLNNIYSTLPWKLSDDSNRLFAIRLNTIRKGKIISRVDWQDICTKEPSRAIQLLEVVVGQRRESKEEKTRKTNDRVEQWYDKDKEALLAVAESHFTEVWDLLLPHIIRLTDFVPTSSYDPRLTRWQKEYYGRQGYTGFERGIFELVCVAGRKMAESMPDTLLEKIDSIGGVESKVITEIISHCFCCLPTSHSGTAIAWLLKDDKRFALGNGYHEPVWSAAANIIRSHSGNCRQDLFESLEDLIVNYHEEDELRSARYWLSGWRENYFGHFWGEAQFFLLPALAEQRTKPFTKELIRVLRRKFEGHSSDAFLRGGKMRGGRIGSKLDPNLDKISEKAWLNIITSEKVQNSNREWLQVTPDTALETSVWQFSRSLQTIAKRYPDKFGKLALRFTANTPSEYYSAIIDAVSLTKPENDFPEDLKDIWKPADINTVEKVIEKCLSHNDRETAISFCRLMSNRASEDWSESSIRRLIDYACNHPDLEPGKLNISCDKHSDEVSIDTLFQNTINCVRGCAARAIQNLLWSNYDFYPKLKPAIASLVNDDHPVVQMASTELLLPVLNINRDQAVEWLCQACERDDRVAGGHGARELYNYLTRSHFEHVSKIIIKMIDSERDEVVVEGAAQVTARWIFDGFFSDEFELIRNGNKFQRMGIAKAASQLISNEDYSGICQKILIPLLNDPEKEVRDECERLFSRSNEVWNEWEISILEPFISSKTFCDDPSWLIGCLKEYRGSLIPLAKEILKICEVFSTVLKEQTNDFSTGLAHDSTELFSVFLRLYEQAESENKVDIVGECLDKLDLLYKNRVGFVLEYSKTIER